MFGFGRKEEVYDVTVYLHEQVIELLRTRIQNLDGSTAPAPKFGEIKIIRLTTDNVSKLTNTLRAICKARTDLPTCSMRSTHEGANIYQPRLEFNSIHLMDIRNKLVADTKKFATVKTIYPFITSLPRMKVICFGGQVPGLIDDESPPLLLEKIAIIDYNGNRVWDLNFIDKKSQSYRVPRSKSDGWARSHSKRNYAVLGLVVGGVGIIVTIIGGDVIRDWLMSLPGWIFSVFK